MEKEKREKAEIIIKKILQEKSLSVINQDEKAFLFDVYSDDMKIASKDYELFLTLPESEKLINIILVVLKEYIGSWHVSPEEMKQLSEYIKTISKDE